MNNIGRPSFPEAAIFPLLRPAQSSSTQGSAAISSVGPGTDLLPRRRPAGKSCSQATSAHEELTVLACGGRQTRVLYRAQRVAESQSATQGTRTANVGPP